MMKILANNRHGVLWDSKYTFTTPIADPVGIADSVGKNHCISITDTLSLKIHDGILLHKQ